MRKIFIITTFTFTLVFAPIMFSPEDVVYSYSALIYERSNSAFVENNHETISVCSDIIKWRYKVINGKKYKRKYNYSKNRWEGDWIPC